jgi:putative chitinase
MIPVDANIMREIAPKFSGAKGQKQDRIIEEVGLVLRSTLEQYKIDNFLRIAHFLSQTCHEAAGFRTTEEFASGDDYEGRLDLGNTEPGDGRRFKGRGLIQLTGRANYTKFRDRIEDKFGVDILENPKAAAEPALSLVVACEYWTSRKINDPADDDNVIEVTKRINGGLNGLADRRQFLAKAKAALSRLEALGMGGTALPAGGFPVLSRGARNEAVIELQRRLRAKGFPVTIDGDFGPGTEMAVKQFQANEGLEPDGIVGALTWAKL